MTGRPLLLLGALLSPVGAVGQDHWTMTELREALSGPPIAQLGALDRPTCEVFGQLTAATVDHEARVLVLDEQSRQVSAFDATGSCLWQMGREGSGPGEFLAPVAISAADGHLYLLDQNNARLEWFTLTESGALHAGAIPTQVRPTGFCWLDSRLFVAGVHEGKVIHEIETSGEVARSFGALHEGDDATLASISRPRFILCDPDANRLIVAAWQMPDIRAYAVDGSELWRAEIPAFIPPELIRSGEQVTGFRPSDEGLTYTATLAALSPREALVQIGTPTYSSFRDVKSFLLELETGAMEPVLGLPRILALGQGLVVAEVESPFPTIVLLRRTSR